MKDCLFRGHAREHGVCGNDADNFRVFMDSAATGWITSESFRPDGSGSGFFPAITSENRNLVFAAV